MTDRSTFIHQIVTNPKDDAIRLVFADWLVEYGREKSDADRAQFIRSQILIAGLSHKFCLEKGKSFDPKPGGYTRHCRCEYCRLRRQEWNVYRQRHSEWLGEFLQPIVEVNVREALALGRPIRDHWTVPATTCQFERGLVYSIRLKTTEFMRHVAEMFARWPITEVELVDQNARLYVGTPLGATIEQAKMHVSRGCVVFGREQAKLPPLESLPDA